MSIEDDYLNANLAAKLNANLAAKFQKVWKSLPWSVYSGNQLTTSKKIVKSVIEFKFSWLDMQHLASISFIKYLALNFPNSTEDLKDLMHAIYTCNDSNYIWYQYYYADVFSNISIFLDEEYALRPPYVEDIGYLHLPYFYKNWLTHYTIYIRLPWVIYTAAVLKKQQEKNEIKKLCTKKGMPFSYRDALIKETPALMKETPKIKLDKKETCIKLVFNKKFLLSSHISAFLGEDNRVFP